MKKTHKTFSTYLWVITFLSLLTIGCQKDDNVKENPGPISIENIITPNILNNGETGLWEIKVTSSGGELIIEDITVHEEFISGWAEGLGTVDEYLPVSNITVPAHSTKTVYSQTFTAFNSGNTDIEVQNSIVVISNGGNATKTIIYKIKMDSGKPSDIKAKTLLLDKSM